MSQLCKLKGAKVIGIAGSSEKCAHLVNELGIDASINYKTQSVDEELTKFAPDGVDHYFDNVGGDISDTVFNHFRNFAHYAFCGSISEYERETWVGQKNFNMILCDV